MGNKPVILVVEDDASIRRLCVRMLKSLGMDVLEASDGGNALEVLREAPPLAAALLDLNLPDIQGTELAQWIRERTSNLPVVYFTGSNPNEIPALERCRPDTHCLTKPFTRESMSKVLEAALVSGISQG
jgi:CheY-like chemotaxis protein